MKKIAVVLINYNGSRNTLACVDSLLKSTLDSLAVSLVIVDNDSEQEDKYYLQSHLPKAKSPFTITLLENPKNTGFSGGNNRGISFALNDEPDAIILLNNDTIVDSHLITNLVTTLSMHPKAGIIVPKIYFANGHEFHASRYSEKEKGNVIWYAGGKIDWKNVIGEHFGVDEVDNGQYDEEQKIEFASGCCMLIRRDVIKKVGMLDERYFLYFEDADFSLRVGKAGYTIIYSPKSILWHKNAGSTGGSGSGLQDYYMTRNRLLFGMTYAPMRAKLALLRLGLRLAKNGREWEKKGASDFFHKRFGKGSFEKI